MTSSRSGPRPLDAAEEAFVRALARVTYAVPRAFDADLQRAEGLSLIEYFTLMFLSEAPGQSLRMNELAAAHAVTLGAVTRIASRLESDGSVRREKSEEDGRGWNAVLTEAGLQRLQHAWPVHLASVRRHVLDNAGDLDLANAARSMNDFAVERP